MDADRPIERREILEERGNRDAFHLAIMISVLFALFLIVLGIAAYNSRFMLMPLVPRAEPSRGQKTENRERPIFQTARPQPAKKEYSITVHCAEVSRRPGIVFFNLRGARTLRGGRSYVTTSAPRCEFIAGRGVNFAPSLSAL
jgi:hypothetical protein